MSFNQLSDEQMNVSLAGQNVLITGVSRSLGIGASLAKRFVLAGANVAVHGYGAYDQELNYPDIAKPLFQEPFSQQIKVLPSANLTETEAVEQLMVNAVNYLGQVNGLILNHAHSVPAQLGAWTAAHIDAHLLVNVRASMLLIQAFANQINEKTGGVITLFTSGQYLGPMVDEIAYAVSKDAIIGLCKQTAVVLADKNIRVNCINPGPSDTGYLSGEIHRKIAHMFPAGRWGNPDDAANLVQFLHSDYANWITGQVIASEGGFKRHSFS